MMDIFKYEAAKQQILDAKYVKDLEQIIRTNHNYLNKYILRQDYNLYYKLYCLALNNFSDKSSKRLPDFIYSTRISMQKELIRLIADKPELYDYQYVIDLFEFDTTVETNTYTSDIIIPLHSIIQDKPLHFVIKFNQSLSSFDSSSTSQISIELQKYLHALRLRQVYASDKSSTVINQYIKQTFEHIDKHEDLSNQILLLQQHTSALQEYQQWLTTQTLN